MKICFTASSGGHLEQLMMLYPLMGKYNSFILTERTLYDLDTKGINIYYVVQINRRESIFLMKFFILLFQTLKVFFKEKPDVIVSTGALATVPICLLGKLFKKKIVFIESFSKVNSPTITGKLIYKFADLFIIQWEELKEFYPNAIYGGGIY